MKLKFFKTHKQKIINIIIFLVIFSFLIYYFKPSLILSKTTTTGGDTASHFYPAYYMKNYLLPYFKLTGWCPGWYAGFPIFHFYMPLCYVLMAILGYFISLEISFKIITALGSFLLPIATFYCFRFMKFKFPTPIIAALFSLIFLFHQGNSMWGGNIPSTMAGEFSYSLSMGFMILFFGLVYKGITEKKYVIENGVLAALTVLTHIYTMIFAVVCSSFLIFKEKKVIKNLKYLFKVYLLAILLSAFWVLPFLAKIEYATPCDYIWNIDDYFKSFFPEIFYPMLILAIIGSIIGIYKKDERILFLLYSIAFSLILYLNINAIGLVDIRFIPFMQLFVVFIAAYGLVEIFRFKKLNKLLWILPLILTPLVIYWVQHNVTYIDYWIKWNYEGFEGKPDWAQYNNITSYLKSLPPGRIMHEYSNDHGKFGTPRAFESFPLFAGKSTLEGLYIEGAVSSPYVFWIQSEMSKTPTCPIPSMRCSYFDVENGTIHLKLFNINYLVATSDKLKDAVKNNPEYTFLKKFDNIEIYKVNNTGHYVEPLKNEPFVYVTDNWKNVSLEWFKNADKNDIPIIFLKKLDKKDKDRFIFVVKDDDISKLSRYPVYPNCNVSEQVSNEEILIHTDCIDQPLYVKVSYFPNWKVEGADKIYLAAPSFMIIYPQQENVRLYYGLTTIDKISYSLSVIAWVYVLFFFFKKSFKSKLKKRKKHFWRFF